MSNARLTSLMAKRAAPRDFRHRPKPVLGGAVFTGAIAAACLAGVPEARAQTFGTHYGDLAICKLLGVQSSVSRMECKFMPVSGSRNLHIEYVSGTCISTPRGKFSVKQFQIVTTPIGTARIPYQLPLTPRSSLGSDFNTGSVTFSAGPASLYGNAGTAVDAYIDLFFPSGQNVETNIFQCSVSLSGVLG